MNGAKRILMALLVFCSAYLAHTERAWGISTWAELRNAIENTAATDIVITGNITRGADDVVDGRYHIDIARALTLRSGSGGPYKIDGNTGKPSGPKRTKKTRLFNVVGSEMVRFEDLILTGGSIGGRRIDENIGGAVYSLASLVFNNCTIEENEAGGGGGGVYAGGDATLTNCTITGNTAVELGKGGGVYAEEILTLKSCVVSGNQAHLGGGVFAMGIAELTDCTLSENKASMSGGGLCASDAILVKCLITKNSSKGEGAGVAVGELTLENCEIFDNPTTRVRFASNIHVGMGARSANVLTSKGENKIGIDIPGGGVTTFARENVVTWLKNDQVGQK